MAPAELFDAAVSDGVTVSGTRLGNAKLADVYEDGAGLLEAVTKGDPGAIALQESEQALADEPTPGLLDLSPDPIGAQARREKRRQRRRTRPHGRAR